MDLQKAAVTQRLAKTWAFAVVRPESEERALEIAQGCMDGGVDALEISFTSPCAARAIEAVKARFGDELLVGAGTVMDETTARLAQMAGAQFIVSNCLSEAVALTCNRYQVPYAPGCTSVTEAVRALELGAAFVKCFPISNVYGPSLVQLFKTPTPWMPLMASGGVNLENCEQWLEAGVDCCGFGSLLTGGPAEKIAANAAALRSLIDGFRSRS